MVVIRVWGIIDGVDVIFNQTSTLWWDVNVPFDADGEYICEIWAEDNNGETGYRTAILYIVDGILTKLCFVDNGYVLNYINTDYNVNYGGCDAL